jgi:hypothetical protein
MSAEGLTAVSIKTVSFLNVKPYRLVGRYEYSAPRCCLYCRVFYHSIHRVTLKMTAFSWNQKYKTFLSKRQLHQTQIISRSFQLPIFEKLSVTHFREAFSYPFVRSFQLPICEKLSVTHFREAFSYPFLRSFQLPICEKLSVTHFREAFSYPFSRSFQLPI